MADRVLRDHDLAVWPFTWCVVHFAGAVEGMAGCLVWRARIEIDALASGEPDCVLVQRLLVDREAIDWKRIEEILDELCRDWYDMVIREGKSYDFGATVRALDAALGVV